MSERPHRLVAAFTGRSTLVVFAALAVGGFLPSLVPALAPVLYPLVLPAYLVSVVVYDGGFLESVVYAVEGSVPIGGSSSGRPGRRSASTCSLSPRRWSAACWSDGSDRTGRSQGARHAFGTWSLVVCSSSASASSPEVSSPSR
jgi:hypothetical protein